MMRYQGYQPESERLQLVPTNDVEVLHEGHEVRKTDVGQGVENLDSSVPLMTRMIATIFGKPLLGEWSKRNKDHLPQDLKVDLENQDIVNGMFEGDNLDGLRRTDVLKIINRAGEMQAELGSDPTDEIARLNDVYSFTPTTEQGQVIDVDFSRSNVASSVTGTEGDEIRQRLGEVA